MTQNPTILRPQVDKNVTGSDTLLRVRDLRTNFATEDGLVKAVDGVNFRIAKRQTFALVGESGCGRRRRMEKAVTLLPHPLSPTRAKV